MKNKHLQILFTLFFLWVPAAKVLAQGFIDQAFSENLEDARTLIHAYTEPAPHAMVNALNSGWYSTAKPHQPLGFDVKLVFNTVFIPSRWETFNVNQLDLEAYRLQPGESPVSPTIFGGSRQGPVMESQARVPITGAPLYTFNLPPGLGIQDAIGFNALPVPTLQFGIGLAQGTDLKLRFLPPVSFYEDARVFSYGVGLLHSIGQYIPGLEVLGIDISLLGAYTYFRTRYFIDRQADQISFFDVHAYTLQALASWGIGPLTIYGGLGTNAGSSWLGLRGEYEIQDATTGVSRTETDPISITYPTRLAPRATIGARLLAGFFSFNTEFTIQEFPVLTLGLGLSIR
jgi:hypothetical protein